MRMNIHAFGHPTVGVVCRLADEHERGSDQNDEPLEREDGAADAHGRQRRHGDGRAKAKRRRPLEGGGPQRKPISAAARATPVNARLDGCADYERPIRQQHEDYLLPQRESDLARYATDAGRAKNGLWNSRLEGGLT